MSRIQDMINHTITGNEKQYEHFKVFELFECDYKDRKSQSI